VNGELLPIGLFSRLCRLSVKQLHHYDEVGLLRPARVDEATGYRYYRRDQVRDAMAIALLRHEAILQARHASRRLHLDDREVAQCGPLPPAQSFLVEALRHQHGPDHPTESRS
jgi:DNA-binding transcriptional MerR regulator